MTRPLSLAHLTVIDLAPPQMIEVAAEIGYDAVGLRLIRVTDTTPGYALMNDRQVLRQTKSALRQTGLYINDIEFVKVTPEFDVTRLYGFLDVGAEIAARHVICAPYDPDLGRLSENLAIMQEACAQRNLSAVLEFFPWTNVPDFSACRAVVEASGRSDLGILVDCLHFDRSDSSISALKSTPAHRLPFFHLCDAPVHPPYTNEDLLYAGRAERCAPAEGKIDLPRILAALPPDIPAALEVPMTAMAQEFGSATVARHVYHAAQRLFSAGQLC